MDVRISKFGCQIYLFLFDDPLKFKFPVSLYFFKHADKMLSRYLSRSSFLDSIYTKFMHEDS